MQFNIHRVAVQEVKRRGEEIFEKLMSDHFPDLIKTINSHIQETQKEHNYEEKNPKAHS